MPALVESRLKGHRTADDIFVGGHHFARQVIKILLVIQVPENHPVQVVYGAFHALEHLFNFQDRIFKGQLRLFTCVLAKHARSQDGQGDRDHDHQARGNQQDIEAKP